MRKWSKERLAAEKRYLGNDEYHLNIMKHQLMKRVAEFKEFKERFADQWVKVEESKKAIAEQEAMADEDDV